MRKPKLLAICAVILLALGGVGWGTYEWRESRRWPFATGTNDSAFLSTTFGMSPPEARRALAGIGARLLTEDEFREAERLRTDDYEALTIFLPSGFVPLFSDDERRTLSLYMPAVELFGASVRARFEFWDGRLSGVEAEIDPIRNSESKSAVNALDGQLRDTFRFERREDSPEVPGAYTLYYSASNARPSLWVNLTDSKKPIIILRIAHPATEEVRQRELQDRERKAFGRIN